MELVYLWVKEYKNIKNQGFNFSPRFTCKYDEKNKKLTIEDGKAAKVYKGKKLVGKVQFFKDSTGQLKLKVIDLKWRKKVEPMNHIVIDE